MAFGEGAPPVHLNPHRGGLERPLRVNVGVEEAHREGPWHEPAIERVFHGERQPLRERAGVLLAEARVP